MTTTQFSSTAGQPSQQPARRLQTGAEFLESLRDDREIWIYGERVKDVTTHPAFRNSARSLAGLYDALHDPATANIMTTTTDTGSGGLTHPFFRVSRSKEDLRRSRAAITCWQENVFGWMGRSPDYKASLITGLGSNPEFFGEFADNARFWYKEVQERVLHIGHAVVQPPVDRSMPPEESMDVFVHVERETDAGLIVSGAKVVATGSPTTQLIYVSHMGAPLKDKRLALTFLAPTHGKGIKMFSRTSYESAAARAASPFDYPLSSRMDENDAVLIFDEALIPWENVLIYDIDKINSFDEESGWVARAIFQSAIRMGVKLDFLSGLLSKALDITGAGQFRGVQANMGELLSYRNAVRAMADGMIENADAGWNGEVNPNMGYGMSYAALAPVFYRRAREIIDTSVASGLIYLNSNAIDFETPEMRPYLDRFLRGSHGKQAIDRSKTMKLLWDAVISDFGGRHELYELNYFGQPELNRLRISELSAADGSLEHARGLVEDFMSEYNLKGWTTDKYVNPTDVNFLAQK